MKHHPTYKIVIAKWILNFFPAFRRAGGRIIHISKDWKLVKVKITYNIFTCNWVGSVFGGSIYASTDHIYMTQLMQILGKEYVVWDKGAAIDFKKPIRKKAIANFRLDDDLLKSIVEEVRVNGKYVFNLKVAYTWDDITYAEITKTLYVASKEYYTNRPAKKDESITFA